MAGVDENQCDIGGAGTGGHISRVLHMSWGVGDDKLTRWGGEIAVSDIDGDALLALGFEAIGDQSQVNAIGAGV